MQGKPIGDSMGFGFSLFCLMPSSSLVMFTIFLKQFVTIKCFVIHLFFVSKSIISLYTDLHAFGMSDGRESLLLFEYIYV